jgi:hypothetical protein
MSFPWFLHYYQWYLDHPGEDREPITILECGADRDGRLYEIHDGRHKYFAASLAGRKDILAKYKEPTWQLSSDHYVPTLPPAPRQLLEHPSLSALENHGNP